MNSRQEKEFTPAQLAAQDDVRAGRMQWQKNRALHLKAIRMYIASHPGATFEEVEKATDAESIHFSILRKNGLISVSSDRLYLRVAGETKEQKKERLKLIQKSATKVSEKMKNEPNKAMQPTPVAVTPRAAARVAPSTSVADL